jgi:hypothetical protein
MMRNLAILLALVVSSSIQYQCQAQSYAPLFDTNSVDWGQFETRLSFAQKSALLSDSLFTQVEKYICDSLSCFHIVDLNADGTPDVVFNGRTGESEQLFMWIHNSTGLTRVFDGYGRVTALYRTVPWLPLSFRLYNYGCCDADLDFIEEYVASVSGSLLGYQLSARLMCPKPARWTTNTTQFYTTPIPFTLRAPCIVRLFPGVDDEHRILCEGCEANVGNQMATYSIGASGFLLGTSTDSVGSVWDYVLMNTDAPHSFAPDIDFEHGDNSKAPGQVAGWVLSKELSK